MVVGDGSRLDAISFRSVGTPLGKFLLENRGDPIHLAGHLSLNEWQGRVRAQLIIEDAARTY